ncbi:type II toxin-antitoxin system HicB family antitoxin [Desulfobacter sp.]|uniref:type II toxin-antitoxin system HicB family antitoxin n=1 Tax=Desulfobacter sp. TaxID=2294 RepID=UPI003D1002EC
MHKFEDYTIEITPLTKEDGGGFLVTFPDLYGCMADGETMEEAIREAKDAFNCWVEACLQWGKDIPAPSFGNISGRFVTCVPQSLHARLTARAKEEGVSLNTFVAAKLAEGV